MTWAVDKNKCIYGFTLIILKIRLDTVYFVENWKLKIIKKLPFICLNALFISWTVQQALVKKKKKKLKMQKCVLAIQTAPESNYIGQI